MNQRGQGKTLWAAIGITLVIAGGLFFAVTQVHLPQPRVAETRKEAVTAVGMARIDPAMGKGALQQRAMLFDPAPLFLPTAVNTSEPELPVLARREPGGAAFQSFPAKLKFGEFEMGVAFPEAIPVPARAIDGLAAGEMPNPFFNIGRTDQPAEPLPRRLGYLEIVEARTGRTVLTAALPANEGAAAVPASEWSPIEMMAAVDPAGLVGELTVVNGSGSDKVDDFFRERVAGQFGVGQRLRPGFYTLRVGP